jgi:hypothetical protein
VGLVNGGGQNACVIFLKCLVSSLPSLLERWLLQRIELCVTRASHKARRRSQFLVPAATSGTLPLPDLVKIAAGNCAFKL